MDSDYLIDLDGNKETSIPFSAYFNNPKAIILETGKECLIGFVNDFQVLDDRIYVLDILYAKSLNVFDMDGHFIRKIGSLGQEPGEYISLVDFTIDTENRFIYLLDYGKRVHKYDLNGQYVSTITPQITRSNIKYIQYYKSKLYLSVEAYTSALSDNMLLESDLNGKILSGTLSLIYDKGWGGRLSKGYSFFMSRLNDTPRYARLFMDYIVTVGKEITPYIKLKSNSLSTGKDFEDFQNGGISRTGMERAIANFSKIHNVHSFIENDDYVIFKYQHGLNKYITVILHKKTGEARLTSYFSNDLIFKSDNAGFNKKFVFSDSKGAYEIMDHYNLEIFLKSIRNNEIVPGLDRLDELLQLEEDANPVIFYYEYK